MWEYKGISIYRCGPNGSGMRWYALMGVGYYLKADSKQSMKQLINEELSK